MAASGGYKKYQRQQRDMKEDTAFAMGMRYVNDPLMTGFVKTLVNYDIINRGDSIEPRDGLIKESEVNLGANVDGYIVHHVAAALIEDQVVSDAYQVRYTIVGKPVDAYDGIDINDMAIVIEDEITGNVNTCSLDPAYAGGQIYIKYDSNTGWQSMHKLAMSNPLHRGMYGIVENQTYILYSDGVDNHLGRIKMFYDGAYKFTVEKVDPEEITPREAVNHGYNMLDDDPYLFENVQNTIGAVEMLGVLPYKPGTTDLMFSANIGEEIEFALNYSYPAADVGKTYVAAWKILDLTTNSTVEILQDVAGSPDYTPGDAITLSHFAQYKQFSIIVELYDKTATSTPLGAMTLASYYLSSTENKGSTANIAPRNYDLTTAQGISDWEGRLVLWGVRGAETILFTSEAYNPSYFPFPNMVDQYDEPVIGVSKYLGDLAIFTTSTLYRERLDETYTYLMHDTIQEKLYLSKDDLNTITLVKNMLYFKSDDYFYMVVPKATTDGTSALQLAPISTNITHLLDNFEEALREIINEMYELDLILGDSASPFEMDLQFYYNYLDGDDVKNCYRLKLYTVEEPNDGIYVEFCLHYDTMLRNWRCSIYQTNNKAIQPYRQTVTDEAVFVNVYRNAGDNILQYITRQKDPVDSFSLNDGLERSVIHHQFVDFGYRDHAAVLKKRYRELQMRINNLAKQDLNFYVSFWVDDILRKGIFKYDVVHNTDPQDPNYGLISVVRSLVDPIFVQGVTTLGEWKLSLSQFPDLSIIKVRTKVSGKGYAGRMKLLSKNQIRYELLSTVWVYRMMNAR